MPYAITPDNVRLHYEEVGQGTPVLFVHEFAGDHRSWEPQLREFGKRYRCIAYAARGYTPSDVPPDQNAYSYQHVMRDCVAVLDHLKIDKAHIVGLSMGGYTALQVALNHPSRVRSMVLAGTGSGSERWYTDAFHQHSRELAQQFEREIRRLATPALIVVGDEDDRCIEPSLFLKATIAASGLVMFPKTGHVVNLEEPDLFNRVVGDFLTRVDAGRWGARDKRSISPTPVAPAWNRS